MKRYLILVAMLLLVVSGRAQDRFFVADTDDCQAYLTLGGGLSYGVSRDQGVSPIAYQLIVLAPYTELSLDYGQWGFRTELSLSPYLLTKNFQLTEELSAHGYGADLMLLSGFEHRVLHREKVRVKVGLAGAGWLIMSYNSSYMNACVSLSSLVAPVISCKGEWDLWRFTLYGSAGAAPVGGWYRPGFAYISNYSSGDSEMAAFNDDYSWNTTLFPLLKTELGIDYRFKKGHSLGASYRWYFLTTRESGDWPFEAARHHLRLVLRIAL